MYLAAAVRLAWQLFSCSPPSLNPQRKLDSLHRLCQPVASSVDSLLFAVTLAPLVFLGDVSDDKLENLDYQFDVVEIEAW
jgi:hypothetical protein